MSVAKITYLCCFALIFFQINAAHAQETITITEITQLDFSKLDIPASGSQTIIINPSSGGYSGSGTVQSGSPARGEYKIILSGTGSSTSITIDIQNISSGSAQLTVDQFTGDYGGTFINSFPRSGLTKPVTSPGTTLYLGATAQYSSGVSEGNLVPSFDIVVTLQ